MITHTVKVYPSKIKLDKKNQLAWKLAEISSDNVKLNKKSIEMVINRIIDTASVAIASLNRTPVISSISALEIAVLQTGQKFVVLLASYISPFSHIFIKD